MKIRFSIFLFLLFFVPIIISWTEVGNLADNINVEIYHPIFPILKGKSENPVLRIKIELKDSLQEEHLENIDLILGGSLSIDEIDRISVFTTGRNEDFSTKNKFGQLILNSDQVRIGGNVSLKKGDNYFWVSVKLKGNANIDSSLSVNANKLIINGRSIQLNNMEGKAKRLGIPIKQHNEGGVHTYRIPGIVTTNKGTLIAVYDIRKNGSVDLQEDVDIGMSRSLDGGHSWEEMNIIMDMGEWGGLPDDQNGTGDPAILVDRSNNTIWVAAIWAHGHPGERNWWASKPGIEAAETSQLMLSKSEDDGMTWSAPINITKQVKKPEWHLLLQGPGTGITMMNGTIVFPAQYKDANQMPHSTIIYSIDHGATWQIGVGAKSNTTESQVVELRDGSLMLNMRDNRGSGDGVGARSVSTTSDMGLTWIEHPTSRKALPEPVCNAGLIKHSYQESGIEKSVLIFINPADTESRRNMTLKLSFDEGMTWPQKYHTLIDEGNGRGYPSLTSIDEETVGILYEGSQADLVFQRMTLKELLKK